MIVPVADRIEGAEQAVRSPFTFDHIRPKDSRAAPLLGQDDVAIREALSEAPDQWPERGAAMAQAGVVDGG